MLASCGDRKVKLWNVASRKNIATLRAEAPVYAAVFAPDGKTLTTVEKWGLTVWDLEKKESVRDFATGSRPLRVSAYPSVKRPLVAVRDKHDGRLEPITLIDTFTGESVITCAGHHTSVACVALDREEKMLATTGSGPRGFDHALHLWDRATGKKTATFEHPPAGSLCLAFSPDSKILACGFMNSVSLNGRFDGNGFRLYEIPSGEILAEVKEHAVWILAFSPDGRLLATGGTEGTITLWTIPAAWRKKK
jgi:WD40 repeat protein